MKAEVLQRPLAAQKCQNHHDHGSGTDASQNLAGLVGLLMVIGRSAQDAHDVICILACISTMLLSRTLDNNMITDLLRYSC